MFKFLRHLIFPHTSNNQRAKLLHPSSLMLVIVLLLGFQLTLSTLSSQFPEILGYAATQISPTKVIELTNSQRQAQGLPSLRMDVQLNAAAAAKAADMFARDYWAHVSPVGTQPWYFVTGAGYNYRYAGENLARDFSDPDSVVVAWMNSPSHRENVLSNRYQEVGVAVVDGKLEGRETTLVVQMFGTRLAAAPSTLSKAVTNISVQAAELSPTPKVIPTPYLITTTPVPTPVAATPSVTLKISPFDVNKLTTTALISIFIIILVIDLIAIYRRKIIRWTSSSTAHLIFMTFLLLAALIINKGHII